MSDTRRFRLPVVIWILAMSFALIVDSSSANAQDMKRSAGSMNRSAGSMNRSAGTTSRSTGASKRGGQSMESKRSSASSRTSSRGASTWESKIKKKDKAEEDDDDSSKSWDDDESDDEEEEQGERTLGRACMYGGNGEVIFRPAGSVCRGDLPEEPEESSGQMPPTPEPLDGEALSADVPEAGPAALQQNQSAHSARPMPVQRRAPQRRPRIGEGKPKGCIFALDGSVMHAPAGLDCN